MTTAIRHANRPRWVLAVLATVVAVLATVADAAPARATTAATTVAIQNGGGASNLTPAVAVGPSASISPGQRLGNDPAWAGFVVATGVAANTAVDGMAGVRTAGVAGEQAAGIIKNTQRIPSLSGTASYRIPDELTSTALGEVKNVANLSYTNQLRDFAAYAQQEGLGFNLYVRGSTTLSGPLQDAVSAGQINLIRNLP